MGFFTEGLNAISRSRLAKKVLAGAATVAAAAGLPLVVTNVEDLPQGVAHGTIGYVTSEFKLYSYVATLDSISSGPLQYDRWVGASLAAAFDVVEEDAMGNPCLHRVGESKATLEARGFSDTTDGGSTASINDGPEGLDMNYVSGGFGNTTDSPQWRFFPAGLGDRYAIIMCWEQTSGGVSGAGDISINVSVEDGTKRVRIGGSVDDVLNRTAILRAFNQRSGPGEVSAQIGRQIEIEVNNSNTNDILRADITGATASAESAGGDYSNLQSISDPDNVLFYAIDLPARGPATLTLVHFAIVRLK